MAKTKARTVAEYLAALPAERREVADEVVALVRKNLPKGYEEMISWGVIAWSVPLTVLADTYNKQPLTYVALGANKNDFSLYLMGAYGNPTLAAGLKDAYAKAGKRFDFGKSCLHFKDIDGLVVPEVVKVIRAIPMAKYIEMYHASRKLTKAGK